MSDLSPTLQCLPTRDSPRQQLRGSLPSSWSAGHRQDSARRRRWGEARLPAINTQFTLTTHLQTQVQQSQASQVSGVLRAVGPVGRPGPVPGTWAATVRQGPGLRRLLRNARLRRRARGHRKVLTGLTFLTDAASGPGPQVTSRSHFRPGQQLDLVIYSGQVRAGTMAKPPGPF